MKNDAEHDDVVCRPRDPVSGEALAQRDEPGYYPGYHTLSQQGAWDDATRAIVIDRVQRTPQPRFFDADAAQFWTLVFEHLIPQSDRAAERRIPIFPVVDERLHADRTVGYRFSDMPTDRSAYEIGRQAIDAEARMRHDASFADLSYAQREDVLAAIHDGEPKAALEIWKQMSVHRFWQLIVGDAIDAYYAHPWAWDEVGFGGPAYPRAYTRLERGDPEPWETVERRYDWAAPADARSDETSNVRESSIESEQHRTHHAKKTP